MRAQLACLHSNFKNKRDSLTIKLNSFAFTSFNASTSIQHAVKLDKLNGILVKDIVIELLKSYLAD